MIELAQVSVLPNAVGDHRYDVHVIAKTRRVDRTDLRAVRNVSAYRAADFSEQLATLMPAGPNVYFDNVGGQIRQTIMNQMKRPARVVECGQISTYDDLNGGLDGGY